MTLSTTTHLNFPGTARSALEFYQGVFGGQLLITSYRELGMPAGSPDATKVVFGQLNSPNGFRVMAYDVPGGGIPAMGKTNRVNGVTTTDQAFFISLRGQNLAELTEYWSKLAVGGTIIEPLAASEWSAGFGMLTDRYGVTWAVDVTAE